MADKHKGTPATFSLGRKFTHCWMIQVLIPPYKHSWWTLGFLPLPHSCGVSYTGVTDPILWGHHNCTAGLSVMVKWSLAQKGSPCVTSRAADPLYKMRSWLMGCPQNKCFLWLFPVKTSTPCPCKKQEHIHLFVTFQALRLIFPLITLKNRGYLYTLRSITVSPVTNHPPSALSMMWKIVAI